MALERIQAVWRKENHSAGRPEDATDLRQCPILSRHMLKYLVQEYEIKRIIRKRKVLDSPLSDGSRAGEAPLKPSNLLPFILNTVYIRPSLQHGCDVATFAAPAIQGICPVKRAVSTDDRKPLC